GPISHFDKMLSIRDEWNAIYTSNIGKSPFLKFDFIILWYRCFCEPDQIRIYRANDGMRTIGFLPLVLNHNGVFRVLTSMTNDHCFHSEPLVLKGYEDEFDKLIFKELIRDRKNWDIFRHSFSYTFSQLPGLFAEDLLSNENIAWERGTMPTYTVCLEKPYEEYFRVDLNYNTRKISKKFKKRLTKAGDYTFQHFQGTDAVRLWPDFIRIEDSGWKGTAGTSIKKCTSNYQQYYNSLVTLLADSKALNMYFLTLNNVPIAGGFGYVDGNIFHFAKTGYDENFKSLSPSNLLLLNILEHLTNNFPEIKRFHMFPWDYGYKHKYINEENYCITTILYGNTLRGTIANLISHLKKLVKSLLKKPSDN
ncbi:GNAT family N-acetyltransferase, partial [Thermodesulfobacteriota bacterium]